jgi:hypothetical protein
VNNDLVLKFTIDFAAEKLGMPHQMRFGAYSLYSKTAACGRIINTNPKPKTCSLSVVGEYLYYPQHIFKPIL